MLRPDRSLVLMAVLAGCSPRVVSPPADADVVADTSVVVMDVPLPTGDVPTGDVDRKSVV